MLKPPLIKVLEREFRLDWQGMHGAPHWARVRWNGLTLARDTGARADVVECFALLHDSQRINDRRDSHHGHRAGDYAQSINAEYLHLDATGLEMLIYACEYHSEGLMEADVTVQTCWDADRLDLARVGITPDPRRLCTAPARRPAQLRASIAMSLGHGSRAGHVDFEAGSPSGDLPGWSTPDVAGSAHE